MVFHPALPFQALPDNPLIRIASQSNSFEIARVPAQTGSGYLVLFPYPRQDGPATLAVRAMGAKAVPWLIADLSMHDSLADKYYAPLFNKLFASLQTQLPKPRVRNVNARRGAAEALIDLGTIAKPAIPELIEALGDLDKDVRHHAFVALDRLGLEPSEARLAFGNFAKFRPPSVYLHQMVDVYHLRGRLAALALGNALDDVSYSQRDRAATDLGRLAGSADVAIPALTRALRDPNKEVRYQAVSALAHIGSPAMGAIPALSKALSDEDSMVKSAAKRAMEAIRHPGASD
jgi:HEAT repeat protein